MKRKLFTLLAAFMALVGFQANAQNAPYDGKTLHFLNVKSANQTNIAFNDTYRVEGGSVWEWAKDYPLSADLPAFNGTRMENESMKYVFHHLYSKWELTNQGHKGVVGDVDAYFTLRANTGTGSNTYTISAASPSSHDVISLTAADGKVVNQFIFSRFVTKDSPTDEYDGVTGTDLDVVGMTPWTMQNSDPQKGGYLTANIYSGRDQGGKNDRALYIVAYDTTLNKNGAPKDVYALYSMDEVRKNWAAYYSYVHGTGPKTVLIVPVWVQAVPVGGRWATTNDFPSEFVNFRNQVDGKSLLTVDGINTFSVTKVNALDFDRGSIQNATYDFGGTHTTPASSVTGDNGSHLTTDTDVETIRLHEYAAGKYELQYFTIADPCTGDLLSINKSHVPGNALITGVGQFGNKLAMKKYYATNADRLDTKATLLENQRTQQFAIWIDDNGNMEFYPLNSWTYNTATSSYRDNVTASAGITPGYNLAVWRDRPHATVNNSTTQGFNESYKIGQMSGFECTGPVSGTHTDYNYIAYRPEKAERINLITEKRYYFIEVGPYVNNRWAYTSASNYTVMNDSMYVLDVVKTTDPSGKIRKRTVVTAVERDRYRGNNGRYFDTPYDSVNMSAHWSFTKVAGGYNIINELGDTLEYSYTAPVAQNTDEAAYIQDRLTNVLGVYKSDVWQSVHLDCYNGYFKLRNMAETTFGVERPTLPMAYLDTLKTAASSDPDTDYYWYAGSRGRQSNAISSYNFTNHLQKDVRLVQGGSINYATGANYFAAGLMMKLQPIAYEYEEGGDDNMKTNHSDDGYFPADDSLCTYLYKEGNYDIIEAVDHQLRIQTTNSTDPVYGLNNAYMEVFSNEKPWLHVEPVVNSYNPDLEQYRYITPKVYNSTYTGGTGNWELNVDYSLTPSEMGYIRSVVSQKIVDMLKEEDINLDSYKWHYVYNDKGEYLVYDTVNTQTTVADQMYGFKFKKVDRTNATAFRFYQPLVADKHLENYIMEFRVAKHAYNVTSRDLSNPVATVITDRPYTNDNYGINSLITPAGANSVVLSQNNPISVTRYQAIRTTLASPAVNGDLTKLTVVDLEDYLQYLAYEHRSRTKYAIIATGSKMLLSTWNDGRFKNSPAPAAASRFHFRGTDQTDCAKDYVDTKYLVDNQMYDSPLTVQQWNVRDNVVYSNRFLTSDNAKYAVDAATATKLLITLADTLKVGSTPGVNGYLKYTVGQTGLAKDNKYREYKNTKDVELYYIQNPTDPSLFLTVDTVSVFAQTIRTAQPGVSGVQLRWDTLYSASSYNGSSVGEVADYRPLQMFAIYGCKTTQADFGTFVFIPAASWQVIYNKPFNQTQILANTKIGNGIISDEFRIGEWGNQVIVLPSSDQVSFEGISATEYIFNRTPYYAGDFCPHNFVQNGKDLAKSNYYVTYKMVDSKNYKDPSMHWGVKKVTNTNNLYNFTPESDKWDEDGEIIPARTNLMEQYYLVETYSGQTAFGGKVQTFKAVPKYPSIIANHRYNTKVLTITCITDNDPGSASGDNCQIKFKKFSNSDLRYDWTIMESIFSDRYLYSKGLADGSGYKNGKDSAYYDSTTKTGGKYQYLRVRESNYVTDSDAPDYHHGVPYYNIIHVTVDPVTKLEVEHYLKMTTTGVKFVIPTATELNLLVNYDKYAADTLQSYKFCFPFAKDGNGNDSASVGNYKDANVKIRTMDYHNQVLWLAVNAKNTSEPKAEINTVDAGVFFFGPKIEGGEEWLGDKDKSGWLKDISRGNVYVVNPSQHPTPVNYGVMSFTSDIQPIDAAKLKFTMVYDTILNNYTKEKIWYYYIQDKDGNYLTTSVDSTAAKFQNGPYTYAYFRSKLDSEGSHGVDKNYSQTFGLQLNKAAATAGHAYPFWIVAQVPSGKYKYLGDYGQKLVFISTEGSSKLIAQRDAMTFELGQVDDNGKFTDIPTVGTDGVGIYGVQGAVKVVNATGAIELYTIDGRMFKSVDANGAEQTITAPRGVVIVKNGTNVAKVIVK